jgi:ribosomal protein S27E
VANSRGFYLRFPCPECGAAQKVLPAQAGTEIRCVECPAVIIVPSLGDLQAADKAHNRSRKTVSAVRRAPGAGAGSPTKPTPPPLELNIIRGHVVSFACPVCHTMMRSTAEELGHTIMCPHCYSPVVVGGEHHKRPPAPAGEPPLVLEDSGDDDYQLAAEEPAPRSVAQRRPAPENFRGEEFASPAEEDEYRLSETEERLPPPRPKPAPVDDDLELDWEADSRGAEEKSPRRQRDVVLQDHDPMDGAWVIQERRDRLSLEDRLAAEAAKRRISAEPPDHPFISGVFGFLTYPSSMIRWVALTLGTALVYYLVANAVASARTGGAELFFSLVFAALAGGAALLLIFFKAVAILAIVQDTAAGADEVEGWPDFNFVDWAGQAFYFLNAIAFSAAPGFVIASVLDAWGPVRWAAPLATAAVFFPVVLLSQLDGMSPFSIVTPGVLRGLVKSPLAWLAFYTVSLTVLAAAGGLGWLSLRVFRWDGAIAAMLLGSVATTALLLEARLVGRLAWFCEETEPKVEDEERESEEGAIDEDREVIE